MKAATTMGHILSANFGLFLALCSLRWIALMLMMMDSPRRFSTDPLRLVSAFRANAIFV